jgi:exodeoxyribonuclease-1
MPPVTLYWHDYETFGADPRRDRPAQFAGLRTDTELNIIGAPLTLYCRPANDFLPSPEACLITGITPQEAMDKGVPEARFIAAIHGELAKPGTCGVGYNTLRFDDEVTRHTLYRNFFDAYEREWRNGNSRWDIIDMARMTAALRPEGIEWPRDTHGKPSFRLELITAANGISHQGAHDALVDVKATIELARLIRSRQPRLYDFVWNNRSKQAVAQLLQLGNYEPVLHVSEKFPAERNCLAVVVALARHPTNNNGVTVFDLSADPAPLLELDAEAIRQRVFTRADELPQGTERIPLKTVHLNRCPILAPMKTLRAGDAERLGLDLGRYQKHLATLKDAKGLSTKLEEVFSAPPPDSPDGSDPDLMLYAGGFFSDSDRQKMARLRELTPAKLAEAKPNFDDARLPEMLFRYRARNFPETLAPNERERWEQFRKRRLTQPGYGARVTLDDFQQTLDRLEQQPDLSERNHAILANLRAYARELIP